MVITGGIERNIWEGRPTSCEYGRLLRAVVEFFDTYLPVMSRTVYFLT